MSEEIKREHLRLDVSLPVAYHILSHDQAQTPLPKHADSVYITEHFAQNLKKINADLEHIIGLIGEKNRLLGDIFRLINQKIELTRPKLVDTDISTLMTVMKVNLSANGISLVVREQMQADQRVDFLLLLDEDQHPILVRGKLIRVINPEHSIAAFSFEDTTPDQERQLVNYIREQELIQLRRI